MCRGLMPIHLVFTKCRVLNEPVVCEIKQECCTEIIQAFLCS